MNTPVETTGALPASPPSPTAVATATQSSYEREAYPPYSEPECPVGGACGGEGIVVAIDERQPGLDQAFGLGDPLAAPASDEVIPVIFDHAQITEEGVVDCFARHYPARAGILFGMLQTGYSLSFREVSASLTSLQAEAQAAAQTSGQLTDQIIGMNDGLGTDPFGLPRSGVESEQEIIDYTTTIAIRNRAQDRYREIMRQIGGFGEWSISGQSIRMTDVIDPAHASGWSVFTDSSYGVDADWELFPTNRQGATRLNALVGHFMATNGIVIHGENGEVVDEGQESPRARSRRWMVGTGLVIAGGLEIAGGVMAIGASGVTGGTSGVAGVALTTVGVDVFSQGLQTLFSPVTDVGRAGIFGDAAYAMGNVIGGEEMGMRFENIWSVASIAASLGGGVVVGVKTLGQRATTVTRTPFDDIPPMAGQLDEARFGVVEVKAFRFSDDITGDMVSLPSTRGWMMELGGRRMWLPSLDSEMRVLLRLRLWNARRLAREFAAAERLRAAADRPFAANEAQSLMELVARNMGIPRGSPLPAINTSRPTQYAGFFAGPQGQMVMVINPQTFGSLNPYQQFMTLAHELNHMRAYQKASSVLGTEQAALLRRVPANSVAYNLEEIYVQQQAEWLLSFVYRGSGRTIEPEAFQQALRSSEIIIENARDLVRLGSQ